MKTETRPAEKASTTTSTEPTVPASGTSTDFKLAEKRKDGTVVLQTEDGRMFTARVNEAVDPSDVLKSATLSVKHDGIVDGVPSNPVVTKADR